MANLGDKIKKIRISLGYTQDEFAKMLEIETSSAVSNWELAKRNPDYNTLVKIAYVGRVSLDYLLKGEDSIESLTSLKMGETSYVKSHSIRDASKAYRGLSLEEQIELLKEQNAQLKKENANLEVELKKLKKKVIQIRNNCDEGNDCHLKNLNIEIEDNGPEQEK